MINKLDNVERLDFIKYKYTIGEYDRETAEMLAKPYLNDLNRQCRNIAKKHNKKYYDVSFVSYMR